MTCSLHLDTPGNIPALLASAFNRIVNKNSSDNNYVVRVPLPRRSLLILYGNPRYNWEHCVLRKDISSRRIVIAYRELTPTYLPNGLEESIGQEILEKAENFF